MVLGAWLVERRRTSTTCPWSCRLGNALASGSKGRFHSHSRRASCAATVSTPDGSAKQHLPERRESQRSSRLPVGLSTSLRDAAQSSKSAPAVARPKGMTRSAARAIPVEARLAAICQRAAYPALHCLPSVFAPTPCAAMSCNLSRHHAQRPSSGAWDCGMAVPLAQCRM